MSVEMKEYEALYNIAKAFHQAYRLSGTVKMKFGLRGIADSDGNSVVDVYLNPYDDQAAATLNADGNARHLQFLESMVPATLLGYQYILLIEPTGESPESIQLDMINTVAPVAYTPVKH